MGEREGQGTAFELLAPRSEGGTDSDGEMARGIQHGTAALGAGLQATGTASHLAQATGAWRYGKRSAFPTSPHPRRRLRTIVQRGVTLTFHLVQKIGQVTVSTTAPAQTATRDATRKFHPPRIDPIRRELRPHSTRSPPPTSAVSTGCRISRQPRLKPQSKSPFMRIHDLPRQLDASACTNEIPDIETLLTGSRDCGTNARFFESSSIERCSLGSVMLSPTAFPPAFSIRRSLTH